MGWEDRGSRENFRGGKKFYGRHVRLVASRDERAHLASVTSGCVNARHIIGHARVNPERSSRRDENEKESCGGSEDGGEDRVRGQGVRACVRACEFSKHRYDSAVTR